MIKCPKCNNTLPPQNQVCQFCGADVSRVPRPVQQAKAYRPSVNDPAPWVYVVYYLIASWWMIDGAWTILGGLGVVGSMRGPLASIVAVFGAIEALFGLGLILKVEAIRAIVNFFCFIRIGLGLLSLAGWVLGGLFLGPIALLGVILSMISIASAGLMIYLIGETDRTPNI